MTSEATAGTRSPQQKVAIMARSTRTTEQDFVDSKYNTARDKRLMVNATVAFLESDLAPSKLTTRVYHFFSQTLSMSAQYNRSGFIAYHLRDERSRQRLLWEARDRISRYARLDPDRGSDVAGMFAPDYDGRYAHLIGFARH